MKTIIPPITYDINRFPTRCAVFIISTVLASFAFLPAAQAVSPPPDGGYPNRTTAEGQNSAFNLTTGTDNTALGFDALWNNTTGSYNTATGEQALYLNVTGVYNTATGYRALYSNTGSKNTADGFRALYSNTAGEQNTAAGFQALYNNILGNQNTAVGLDALYYNTFGDQNTAIGFQALFHNTWDPFIGMGCFNTAVGFQALFNNYFGFVNTAVGWQALYNISTGSGNTALGNFAGVNVIAANNVICIGAAGDDVDNSCFIGNIRGVQTVNADAIPVLIDSAGQLGTQSSSRRFKSDIKLMGKASESLLALKPVTFHYKSDTKATPQFGLIAEEVAKVNQDLVVRDRNGEIYTVRYDAVNAMLLNEFLKEHRKNEEQEATIAQLKSGIETLTATVKEQAAQIQKVSAQLQANKPTPQVVLSNQ
jgi:hypothetical protein